MRLREVVLKKRELPSAKAEVATTLGLGSTPASSPCLFFLPQSFIQRKHTEFLSWPDTEVVKREERPPSLRKPDKEEKLQFHGIVAMMT